MANTLAIDVVDRSVAIDNHVNIAIINQPNPVHGFEATAYQVKMLIQIADYFVTDSATGTQISGFNYYDYFPSGGGGGGSQQDIDELKEAVAILNERCNEMQEEITEIDVSKLSVTEYEKNTEYPRGRIVYVTPGQLYQANQDFTSNNDPDKTLEQAFNYDIQQGYLSPVTDAEVGDLESRVDVLEQKIINAEEVEFYNTYAEFPETGVVDIIYVDNSDGKTYTWDPVFEEYNAMNTNNIIDGSVIQSTI